MSSNRRRTVAIVAALLLVTAIAVPAVAAAETTLSVTVDQDHETGEATVTVTDTGTAVENATVTVTADENDSYAALNQTYETDQNGTVVLPNPNETIDVTLSVDADNETTSVNETLIPHSNSLDVSVEQSAGDDATVQVTQYGDAVENATVTVSTDESVSYAALNETSDTDENGTVVLPAPSEDLNVTVTATAGNVSAETTAWLTAPELAVSAVQNDAGELYIEVTNGGIYVENATVDVETDDGEYAYDGEHTATDGTLTLPAPTENVTVNVTTTVDNETATDTVTLVVQTDDNPNNDFAESLVTFIEHMKAQNYEGPLGQQVAAFVHANNPASENANGPPAHVTGDDAGENETDETDRRGPPENVTTNNASHDDRTGPPEHAGGNDDDKRTGPPAHAGGNDSDEDRSGPPGNGPGN